MNNNNDDNMNINNRASNNRSDNSNTGAPQQQQPPVTIRVQMNNRSPTGQQPLDSSNVVSITSHNNSQVTGENQQQQRHVLVDRGIDPNTGRRILQRGVVVHRHVPDNLAEPDQQRQQRQQQNQQRRQQQEQQSQRATTSNSFRRGFLLSPQQPSRDISTNRGDHSSDNNNNSSRSNANSSGNQRTAASSANAEESQQSIHHEEQVPGGSTPAIPLNRATITINGQQIQLPLPEGLPLPGEATVHVQPQTQGNTTINGQPMPLRNNNNGGAVRGVMDIPMTTTATRNNNGGRGGIRIQGGRGMVFGRGGRHTIQINNNTNDNNNQHMLNLPRMIPGNLNRRVSIQIPPLVAQPLPHGQQEQHREKQQHDKNDDHLAAVALGDSGATTRSTGEDLQEQKSSSTIALEESQCEESENQKQETCERASDDDGDKTDIDDVKLERYKCPICFDFITNPSSCGNCTNRFCYDCLVKSFSNTNNDRGPNNNNDENTKNIKCPCCRYELKSVDEIIKDKELEKEIGDCKIQIKCMYCRTYHKLKEHNEHTNQCDFILYKCKYVQFGCQWVGYKKFLSKHEDECIHHKLASFIDQYRAHCAHTSFQLSNQGNIITGLQQLVDIHTHTINTQQQRITALLQQQNPQQQSMGTINDNNSTSQPPTISQTQKSYCNIFDILNMAHMLLVCPSHFFLYEYNIHSSLIINHKGSVHNILSLLPSFFLCTRIFLNVSDEILHSDKKSNDDETEDFILVDTVLSVLMCVLFACIMSCFLVDNKSSYKWQSYKDFFEYSTINHNDNSIANIAVGGASSNSNTSNSNDDNTRPHDNVDLANVDLSDRNNSRLRHGQRLQIGYPIMRDIVAVSLCLLYNAYLELYFGTYRPSIITWTATLIASIFFPAVVTTLLEFVNYRKKNNRNTNNSNSDIDELFFSPSELTIQLLKNIEKRIVSMFHGDGFGRATAVLSFGLRYSFILFACGFFTTIDAVIICRGILLPLWERISIRIPPIDKAMTFITTSGKTTYGRDEGHRGHTSNNMDCFLAHIKPDRWLIVGAIRFAMVFIDTTARDSDLIINQIMSIRLGKAALVFFNSILGEHLFSVIGNATHIILRPIIASLMLLFLNNIVYKLVLFGTFFGRSIGLFAFGSNIRRAVQTTTTQRTSSAANDSSSHSHSAERIQPTPRSNIAGRSNSDAPDTPTSPPTQTSTTQNTAINPTAVTYTTTTTITTVMNREYSALGMILFGVWCMILSVVIVS